MSEIYFVRHGQASFGEENYDRLSQIGIKQARLVARHLARIGRRFDAVYSGCMERQRKTAREFIDDRPNNGHPDIQLELTEAFDEYNSFAVWEIQIPLMLEEDPALSRYLEKLPGDRKRFQIVFEKVMDRWIAGIYDPPESPRWQDFVQRVRRGLEEIMRRHGSEKRLLVFSSGGPISVAVQTALDISDKKTMEISWQLMNASITRFKYNRQGIMLAGFNDVSHLELEGDPTLLTYR